VALKKIKQISKGHKQIDFEKRIFVGLTCTSSRRKKEHWRDQLREINKLGIKEISFFPTTLNPSERPVVYRELEKSCVKTIKLVHIRGQDFTKKEMDYFFNRFNTRLFNCHEHEFDMLYKKFQSYRKHFVLELNYDGVIENKLEPNKMNGFCIDFSHIYSAKERHKMEWDYMVGHLKDTKFHANHLNGYTKRRKRDLHFVTNKNQFNYLTKLPACIFSKVIGMELENTISKQLEFKKYIVKILNRKFKN
jgi:hypothetical protein